MDDLQKQLQVAFEAEAGEHIEAILKVINGKQKTVSKEELHDIYRRAHSIKGAARAVNFAQVETVGHRMEAVLSKVSKDEISFDDKVKKIIKKGLETIEDLMPQYLSGKNPEETPDVIALLDTFLGTKDSQVKDEEGSLEASEETKKKSVKLAKPKTEVSSKKKQASRNSNVESAGEEDKLVRIKTKGLDDLTTSISELFSLSKVQSEWVSQKRSVFAEIENLEEEFNKKVHLMRLFFGKHVEDTSANELHTFLNFQQTEFYRISKQLKMLDDKQSKNIWQMNHLCGQVNDDLLKARLIRAGDYFRGFSQMMRELASTLNKKVDFIESGLDVEVDRLVLQGLKDPLMHLLRNCVAHGIESPEERVKAGKSEIGTVKLTLENNGNIFRVVLDDDGKGLNLKEIADRAKEVSLVQPDDLENMTEDEIASLILEPGFSTSKEVDQISGRGIGMSVLKDTVSSLGGSFQLFFKDRIGFAIDLRVPLNVSTHSLLLLRYLKKTFALPFAAIESVGEVSQGEIKNIDKKAYVQYQNDTWRVLSLGQIIEASDTSIQSEKDQAIPLVFVRSGHKKMAIAVGEIIGEVESVIRPVGSPLGNLPYLQGAASLPDSSHCLVLSPNHFEKKLDGFVDVKIGKVNKDADLVKKTPAILVVDDSVTTRTLEKSILEAQGYRVFVAVDGFDGLKVLREQAIDLVVVDLEMPKLDGFGMIEKMRKEKSFDNIPVIIVSSVDREGEKERGLKLGADRFILKQRFDNKVWLETVEQLI